MMNLVYIKILLLILGSIAVIGSAFKILKEYERAVVFRLGKFLSTKGPGLVILIPLIDRIQRVDLRLVSIDVPRQDIMTRDNVPVTVDAVVYFHVSDPAMAIINIQDIYQSTFLLAQATLRSVLGQVELDELLSQQAKINKHLQEIISVHISQWGINITMVEIKEVTLPEEMKRAMAKQAETERERRARLIDAQGEYQASRTLAEAGEILSSNPHGLQLRYLQTLRDISTNKGSTILFPFPLDLLTPFLDNIKRMIKTQEKSETAKSKEIGHEEAKITHEEAKKATEAFTTKDQYPRPQAEVLPSEGFINKYKQDLQEGKLSPQYVQWVITDKCQFKCGHCEIVAGHPTPQELETSEAKKVIDDLADMGCGFLSLTGGEPLLRKDLFEIARYAKEKGIRVGLTTNGYAVEENVAALSDAKFDSVVITLDGYGETQNRIRDSKDSYERGIRAIEFFHDIGAPRICVSSILLDENLREFPKLTEDAFRAGANLLQIQPRIFDNGQPLRNQHETVKDSFRFILEARRRGFAVEAGELFGYLGALEPFLRPAPFFCGCGWNTFCINSNGIVQGCPVKTSRKTEEGDCRKDSMQHIWTDGFASFRKDIPEDLQEGCLRCPHLSECRGGCWLFRLYGLNPCFLLEAEEVYRQITDLS
ncbi:radical SAM protein [bacterium]|nr:radical SAM protein [bacterium]